MAEHRIYPGVAVPPVSTAEFHRDRERAPHLEQHGHRPRLLAAAALVAEAVELARPGGSAVTGVTDLGCGDGGLLQLVGQLRDVCAWGYDFQPSNEAGWRERRVVGTAADVFGADRDTVIFGEVAVMTEVLEHLADPHAVVRWVGQHARFLVASSPWNETDEHHDECHAWAWDFAGYADLLRQGGWKLLRHLPLDRFQLVLAERS